MSKIKWLMIGLIVLMIGAGIFDICYIGLQVSFQWSLLVSVGFIVILSGAIIWAVKAPEYYIKN